MGSKKRKRKQHQAKTTRDGEPRMSAVILELAEPLLKKYGNTPGRWQNIIALAIAAWNKAVLPANMQAAFDRKVLAAIARPGKDAEAAEVQVYIMDVIAKRRAERYPHLRKFIVSFDFVQSEGKFALNVASAPIPTGN
jgi:hypothetical protein